MEKFAIRLAVLFLFLLGGTLRAGDDRFGICTGFGRTTQTKDPVVLMPLISGTGAGWIRDDLAWAGIEKSKGVYAIPPETMAWINAVSAAGIKKMLQI